VPALAQHDERVTCTFCRFSYPGVRGFCPACGESAPVHPEPSAQPYPLERGSSPPPSRILRSLFLLAASLVVASGFFVARVNSERKRQPMTPMPASQSVLPAPISQSATAPGVIAEIPKSQNKVATPRGQLSVPVGDPADLWKKVKHGDSNAEVTLAEFYLGENAAQNCEQAHLLLLAASKNRNKAADDILSGDYAQRCR